MSHSKLFLLYLPITALLPALLSWYVGRNLAGPRVASRRLVYATLSLMFLVGLSACLALVFWSEQDRTPIRPMVGLGFYALGYLLTAAALLLCRDALRLLLWLVARMSTKRWMHGSTGVVLLLAGACVWLGHRGAEQAPSTRQVTVPIRNLPPAFTGYRIAHLTDLHLHGMVDRARVQRLVAQVNALDVDLVAITGDIVDGPLEDLRSGLSALGPLRAHDGVYVAIGNHEYYADADASVEEFQRLGFKVLLNEHRVVYHGLDRIAIAGVTNPQRGMHGAKYTALQGRVARMLSDPRAAIREAPVGIPRILLAHQPKSVAEARGLGFDLALAGHTHGGQFFPWTFAARLIFPYAEGLYVDGPMRVYVGRGIGTFGPRLRLGSAPEIAVLELRPAN